MRASLVVALAGVCAAASAARAEPPADRPDRVAEPATALRLPMGVIAADGASCDPVTGLPVRIVHEASGVTLVLIPAGEFVMGAGADAGEEIPQRRIIRRAFYMSTTEVTMGQFRRFADASGYKTDAERGVEEQPGRTFGAFAQKEILDRDWHIEASWRNPFPNLKSQEVREDNPVVQVSWNDAKMFCAHYGLTLPTETQFEYAARAGSAARFPWGDGEAGGAGFANVSDEATKRQFPDMNMQFPFDDGHATVARVASFKPNAWGLHDMIGNLEEWCLDTYRSPKARQGDDERAFDGGPGTPRVMRGGSWLSGPSHGRSGNATAMLEQSRRDFIGFRVVMNLEQ